MGELFKSPFEMFTLHSVECQRLQVIQPNETLMN